MIGAPAGETGAPARETAARARGTGADPMLVVGSVALDEITTPSGHRDDVVGGAAVHFAAAASLFGEVRVVGVVGDDYPPGALDFLGERGVDLSGVDRRPGATFRWGGAYHDDFRSRETTYTELGVFAAWRPVVAPAFRGTPWVFLANIHPDHQLALLNQIGSPRLMACDTMNYWIERTPERLAEVVARIDLVTLNDEEARQLSGESDLRRAGRAIQRMGPDLVLVKRGEKGAILFAGEEAWTVPAFPLAEVTDPTGAGDAFAGGLFGYLARRGEGTADGLRRAVVYGCALGAFACEGFGTARLRTLTMREVEDRVRTIREPATLEGT